MPTLYCGARETNLLKNLTNMIQLRKVGFYNVSGTNEYELCISFQSMNLLCKLYVEKNDYEKYDK